MSGTGYWDPETGDELQDYELEERYDDWLDEVCGEVHIGSLSYVASKVLKEVDPIAYRVGMSDFVDSEMQDGRLTDEEPEGDDENEDDTDGE